MFDIFKVVSQYQKLPEDVYHDEGRKIRDRCLQ